MIFFLLEPNDCEAAFFESCFNERGHKVVRFKRPLELLDALRNGRPHAIVTEWVLPEMTGQAVVRCARELYGTALPIVILSSMDRAEAIMQAFEAGVDDYLLKPMLRSVLNARIESLMRKLIPNRQLDAVYRQQLVNGPYRLDFAGQTAHIEDVPVAVTPKELDLAWLLFCSLERFISKSELVACVWGKRAEIAPHTVTQHMHVLRKKFKFREKGYQLITFYGSGYRLNPPVIAPNLSSMQSRELMN
jgi:two-component system, OmpR family, response regulator RegX3